MADPDHVPELDGFDRMTVLLYRAGIAGAALALLAYGAQQAAAASGTEIASWWPHAGVLGPCGASPGRALSRPRPPWPRSQA